MISYSTQPGSPVIEISVEGVVTNRDLEASMARFKTDLEAGKTRVIEVIEHFTGIEPAAIWTDFRLGLPLAQKVTHVAVVADQAWIRAMSNLGHFFTRAELKVFEPSQLAEARIWIRSA